MRGHRRRAMLLAAVMAFGIVLSACGGGDEDVDPEPEPSAQETETGPPAQPEGADGITWEIQNWEDHAEDPAVLTWKQFHEAVAASITEGSLLPAARDLGGREALDTFLGSIDYAVSHELQSQELTYVKVANSEKSAETTELVMCVWSKTAELVTSDGEYASDVDPVWHRQEAEVSEKDGNLIVTKADYDGTCKGGDPT